MPKPDGSLSAVVVSGGKQYRVSPGDQILVDRLDAEPGSSLKLDRVLLFRNGDEITVGAPGVDGMDVEVKVLAHRRGPRVESLRYKSKKRVRVHHGGRADLTALQIIAVGGMKGEAEEKAVAAAKTTVKTKATPRKQSIGAGSASTSRPARKVAVTATAVTAVESEAEKPAKRVPRKKESK